MNDELSAIRSVIDRFNSAFLRHDPALLDPLIADDCVMEGAWPAPDGSCLRGRAECLAFWQELAAAKDTRFELESVTIDREVSVILWRFYWGATREQSVRGVNVMKVRDGLIVEALGYIKGQP